MTAEIPISLNRFMVAEHFGRVPYKRDDAINLARQLGERSLLLIDFTDVEDATSVFLGDTLMWLQNYRRNRRFDDSLWAVTNANDDVDLGLDAALSRLTTGVVKVSPGQSEFLGSGMHLRLTYRTAAAISETEGSFTVPELAEIMGLRNPSAMGERLKRLHACGAIARRRDSTARRGVRYLYRTPVKADIIA